MASRDIASIESSVPSDLPAERVVGEQRLGEEHVDEVVGRVLAHAELLEDHLALRLDLVGAEGGRHDDVVEEVEREVDVLVEDPDVERRVLLGR